MKGKPAFHPSHRVVQTCGSLSEAECSERHCKPQGDLLMYIPSFYLYSTCTSDLSVYQEYVLFSAVLWEDLNFWSSKVVGNKIQTFFLPQISLEGSRFSLPHTSVSKDNWNYCSITWFCGPKGIAFLDPFGLLSKSA